MASSEQVIQAQAAPQAPVRANAQQVDQERAKRYTDRLLALQESRVKMQDRSSSLMAQTPGLEQELLGAMRSQLIAAGALQFTPQVIATPQLLQTFQTYRGQSGEIILQPQLLLWYAFQDNTLARQQLFLNLTGAQRDAALTYATLENSRVALQQLAENADENFLRFRQLSDVMGRRSSIELTQAEELTARWTLNDPLHAGAALVRAHALRASGRFDECTQLLDSLDNQFPVMESIANSIIAQIKYLGGSVDEAKRLLDKATSQARQSGAAEPFIVYGWLMMAEQKWGTAKTYAARARQLDKNNLEAAILEGLATAYEKPSRARDALQLLRRVQLQTSPDDWQYREALALVHSMARDPQFANREIAAAVAIAPSHLQAELEREQQDLLGGQAPIIDWAARLKVLWLR